MKKLLTTPITDTVGFGPTAGTWEFLQQAYQETIDYLTNFIKLKDYNPFAVYILYGLELGSATLSEGIVYYQHELFYVPAFSWTPILGQVPVLSINTAYFTDPTADPTEFTDGNSYNVHQIRTMTMALGVSGSTISDVFTCERLLSPYVKTTTLSNFNGDRFFYMRGHETILTTATNNTGGILAANINTLAPSQQAVGSMVRIPVQFGSSAAVQILNAGGVTTIISQKPSWFTIGVSQDVSNKKLLFEYTLLSNAVLGLKISEYETI